MSIYIARLRETMTPLKHLLMSLMSSKEMPFQVPPKTFRLYGWITQRIWLWQWVPKPSGRRLRKPECHK